MNLKFLIAYDGTAYLGWQKTKMGPSIEQTLQTTLEQILQEPLILQAASRTDAGVHAYGQVVNCITQKSIIDLNQLRLSLNQLLPKDIVVRDCEEAQAVFHPTLDCICKEYMYQICFDKVQMPQYRYISWHVPYILNLNLMQEAAALLIGEHDFRAFCNRKKNETYSHYMRKIEEFKIEFLEENRLKIFIKGNNFLYKMVRNLVGTLVYVGRGKLSLKDIENLLQCGCRTCGGITAPAKGLTLVKVSY